MYAFAYWHTYYDSSFLSHPFKLSPALYQDLSISNTHLCRWPALEMLPELPRLYEVLQRFILDEGNWSGCMCNQSEIDSMQLKINSLLLTLQCQKQYGLQFWEKSYRRIQASIVHLIFFLKRFISTLVPQDCTNLLQALRIEKLSVEMARLEHLINEIIKIMKPIHQFLFCSAFQQEQILTQAFFEEFNDFIQNLPKMRVSQLVKAPKLMEYICIVNPIEAESYQPQKSNHIRRKNATVYEKPKQEKKEYSLEKQNGKHINVISNSIVKIKQKKHSLQKYSFDNADKSEDFVKNYQIFKFKEKVRKYSVYNKGKKKTVTSLETKEKTSSIEKDRSPTHDRSITFVNDPVKLKSRTLANDIRHKDESLFLDRRSRELTAKSILSRRSRSIKKVQSFEGEQIEHEREEKTKKKKAMKLPIKTNRYSEAFFLNDGKPKGWALVRENLNKRIAERKLKRLILL